VGRWVVWSVGWWFGGSVGRSVGWLVVWLVVSLTSNPCSFFFNSQFVSKGVDRFGM
jgi:hypothetical protein